jgi:signal transduction histidine kinase/CheY-like chemotaxis protein
MQEREDPMRARGNIGPIIAGSAAAIAGLSICAVLAVQTLDQLAVLISPEKLNAASDIIEIGQLAIFSGVGISLVALITIVVLSLRDRSKVADRFSELLADNQPSQVPEPLQTQDPDTLTKALETELQLAAHRADWAIGTRDRFFGVVSHEVRTPINSMMGMARLMLRGRTVDGQRQKLQTILEAGQDLMDIVNAMLELTRLDNNELTLKPTNVRMQDWLNRLTGLVNKRAEQKGLNFSVYLDPALPEHLMFEQPRLRMLALQLTENAIKFTDSGSVTVSLLRQPNDPATGIVVDIVVEDTGPDMAESVLEHAFDRVQQGDSSIGRRHGGTGIGLAVAKGICDLMGGNLDIQSGPTGTRATASMILEVGFAPITARTVTVRDLPPLNVLVAEDTIINQHVMRGYLEIDGHKVTMVENGALAVQAVQRQRIDVVLMDVNMPEMDGFEATRQIRTLGGERGAVPIIATTAIAMPNEPERCFKAGMNGYVAKPIAPELLVQAISKVHANTEAPSRTSDQLESETAAIIEPPANESRPFDHSVLAEVRGLLGDEFVEELIEKFEGTVDGHVKLLQRANKNMSLPDLLAAAHSLKSCTGSIGLTEAWRMSIDLENVAESGKTESAVALSETLQTILQRDRVQIHAYLEESNVAYR